MSNFIYLRLYSFTVLKCLKLSVYLFLFVILDAVYSIIDLYSSLFFQFLRSIFDNWRRKKRMKKKRSEKGRKECKGRTGTLLSNNWMNFMNQVSDLLWLLFQAFCQYFTQSILFDRELRSDRGLKNWFIVVVVVVVLGKQL